MILRKALYFWLIIPASFCWFGLCLAQPDKIFFERFDEEQGLPNYLFIRIIQDRQGLLWMGGYDGLARYDGHSIKEYRHNHADPHSISGNRIISIYEDSDGRLWLGTAGAGVNVSDLTKSIFYAIEDTLTPLEKNTYMVNDITEDSSGRVWLASNLGIIILQQQNGVFSYSDDTGLLNQLSGCKDLQSPTVLKTGNDGKIWIGTSTGLCMYDPAKQQVFCPEDFEGIPARSINDISFDRINRLWVSCNNEEARLFYLEDSMFRFHPFDKVPLTSVTGTLSFTFDLDNRIWISVFAREALAYDFRDSTLFLQSKVNSNMAHERFLRKPFVDHSGNVWIPCEGFMIYPYPKGFSYYHHSYAFHQSNTFTYGTGDTLWIGYREKGMIRLNERTGQTDLFSSESLPDHWIPVDHISKMSRLKNGNKIIVGFGDVAIMDSHDKVIRHFEVRGTNRAMYEDSKGRIWIGGYGGLLLFTEKEGVIDTFTLPIDKGPDGNFIQGIAEDASGNIWFASDIKGLGKLNPETGSVQQFLPEYGNPNSLPGISIVDLEMDKSNILWLATDMALVKFDPVTNAIKSYDRNYGIENDHICAVIADNDGFIWVSTHSGISRFDPVKEEFVNYNTGDGLTNKSYYRRNKFYSSEGFIFFGGKKGMDYFHPDHIRSNPTAPMMYLSGITIDNQNKISGYDLIHAGEIKLTPSNNLLEIEFIGLHYTAQEEVSYQYQLEGLNEKWIDLGHERKILLTHMKPGDYTLRAKAITSDQIESSKELMIPIRVIPPFYATLWFRILGTLILIGAIVTYVQYREFSIKRKDKREADINHKINELEKRALQAQMNPHFIYNSMNSIQQFMISHDVEGAMKYLTRFSRVLRTVLNMSAENRIPLYDEIKLIEDYLELENMRFPDKFDYKIHVSPELNIHTVEIPPFFIQPQVENAIRHGLLKKDTQGHLLVDIKKEGQYMRIIVEDNGIGRAAARASKHGESPLHESKGMAIVEERLKHLHSGNGAQAIRIIDLYNDSHEASGTRVEITLPLEED